MQINGRTVYAGPDEFAHVALWAWDADTQAERLNRAGFSGNGKFIAGSFTVEHIEGRVPAVVGKLTGDIDEWRKSSKRRMEGSHNRV